MSEDTFYMYHKEYAPKGRLFDHQNPDDPTPEALVQQGWSDAPVKQGINLLGPGGEKAIDRVAGDIKAGRLSHLDDHDGRVERRLAEQEAAVREQREKLEKIERLKTERTLQDNAREGIEEEADTHADVARQFPDAQRNMDPDVTQVQVPKGTSKIRKEKVPTGRAPTADSGTAEDTGAPGDPDEL